ncbi:ubiquitin carboxyl-terminal hydrolase 3-like isoform X2 [Dysidea avara]|uniref:ubiquitin carboxyl-terminal hydrolase 3-like isoform X2 n=1 Tax=Dysidea avara TaxID=196820 RepID=UPI00331CFD7A
MECPHLEKDTGSSATRKLQGLNQSVWSCEVCRSQKSSWLCLHCGTILCGRYVNAHAKSHFEKTSDHCLCMSMDMSIFCYLCDDFIINDNVHVSCLRTYMQEIAEGSRQVGCKSKGSSSGILATPPKVIKLANGETCQLHCAGLRNLGNTCFMNAVLQSLGNNEEFCKYFLKRPSFQMDVNGCSPSHKYDTRSTSKPEELLLAEELRKIFIALWEESNCSCSPDSLFSVVLKVVPQFRGYQQQDAHEFMRYLLDELHEELRRASCWTMDRKGTTIVSHTFGGTLQSDVVCLICGTESQKLDPILDFSLDIPEQFICRRKGDKLPNCTLEDCLKSFTSLEKLEESEWYYCEKCGSRQQSSKQLCMYSLPNSLGKSKENCLYDLAAVVVHHGSGVGSGHYTTYACSSVSGSWYHFNDSTVSCVTPEHVSSCKAYILFYARRSTKNNNMKIDK